MTGEKPRVFLDSNIWFSAFYGSVNCEKLLKAHIDHKITAVISTRVLEEIVRNIKEKIPKLIPVFNLFISSYPPEIFANPKSIPKKILKYVESEDQPIFAAAINAGVKFFVTGNIGDFQTEKLEKLTQIKILTPAQAVKELRL